VLNYLLVFLLALHASLGFRVCAQNAKTASSGLPANYRQIVAKKIREKSWLKVVGGRITVPHQILAGFYGFQPGVCVEADVQSPLAIGGVNTHFWNVVFRDGEVIAYQLTNPPRGCGGAPLSKFPELGKL
jgi:hypothetical protein